MLLMCGDKTHFKYSTVLVCLASAHIMERIVHMALVSDSSMP